MNNRCKLLIVLFLVFMVATLQVQAEKYKGTIVKKSPKATATCLPPAKTENLALNNVRAYLKTNGTMWHAERGEYEVPKGSGKTSLFSSSLWIGGNSAPTNGNLYFAGMRFGSIGNDYWTGPISMDNASIDQASCSFYDQFYQISRIEVERHIAAIRENDPTYETPNSIKNWPAHGRSGSKESRFLAPYVEVAGDPNAYDPTMGDYPYYDFSNELCPWTPVNLEKAKIPYWLNEAGEPSPIGPYVNPDALPMPRERIETRQEYGWDNKMIYADHVLKGDQTFFWFLNDAGAPHTETNNPYNIGLEIRVQAFAFSTNDELNKMTFYSYEIINRGSITLYDTYFSQWCDPDLGYSHDDYVGCDVIRGLGYCYNGYEIDGSGEMWAYGENPPAVGLDFFQGPYIDNDDRDNPKFQKERADINGNPLEQEYCKRFVHHIFDHVDDIFIQDDRLLTKYYVVPGTTDTVYWNDQFAINGVNFGDGIVDNERFGMRAFTYHDNASGKKGDPRNDFQYYYYLTGRWYDGSPFTYGEDGAGLEGIECKFVFPKGTDYCNWGTRGTSPGSNYNEGGRAGNWSEKTPQGNIQSNPNTPNDRRFMQSAGPFTLSQGACNYITVGVPWARTIQGGVEGSITLLMVADDKCQALFENCFKLLDGPDAPTLTIREYDEKFIFLLTNSPLSNNANEDYREIDQTIPQYLDWMDTVDREYRFEGYQIFQVSGPDVGANDLDNPNLARIIRQYDVVNFDSNGNPIGRLINWEFDEDLQLSSPKAKVNGSNSGIEHSFEVTQDMFATGSSKLVNYKTYYYIAVAYAYNEFWPFSIVPDNENGLYGQKTPYLRGRKTAEGTSVVPIAGVPHPPTAHGGGATLQSDYGAIPYITRIDGQGNGGVALDLTQETLDEIFKDWEQGIYSKRVLHYDKNAGPLNIRVIDPLRVKPYDYTLVIKDPVIESDTTDAVKNRTDINENSYWELTIDPSVSDEELRNDGLVNNNNVPIRKFTSQTSIGQYYEQIIIPLGLSVTIHNKDFESKDPQYNKYKDQIARLYRNDTYRIKMQFGQCEKIDKADDIVFENNGYQWITGLKDENLNIPSNWIRAGSKNFGPWTGTGANVVKGNFRLERLEDIHFPSEAIIDTGGHSTEERAFKDFSGKFGSVCGGTWAPYVLASPYDNGPQAKYTSPEPIFSPEDEIDQPPYGATGKGLDNYFDYKGLTKFFNQPGYNQTMTNLYSVNVVITPDQSKWTRCVVLEACQNKEYSEGGALRHEPRKHTSVNKDGTPDLTTKDGFGPDGTEGMGWFPGYALNIETGERLNMMFSENSDKTLHTEEFVNLVKGTDMIFNPTATYAISKHEYNIGGIYLTPGRPVTKQEYDLLYEALGTRQLIDMEIERVWGGMHYVYVCNSVGNTSSAYYLTPGISAQIPNGFLGVGRRNFNLRDTIFRLGAPLISWGGYIDQEKQYPYYDCGPYDQGEWLVQKFKQVMSIPVADASMIQRKHTKMQLFNNVMYTHIPMQPEDPELQKQWMSCDVTYKIRVTRPYMRYISRWYEAPNLRDYEVTEEYAQYKGCPVYKLSTKGLNPTFNDTRLYQSILDNINIVPNPYYGSSFYETNALQTTVKITNLPTDLKNQAPVTISIYTVSGILVRTLTKGDSATSYVDWDLKNYANIPVASGVYIIHVNCPGIGERMLKFFCTMRQTDLNTF